MKKPSVAIVMGSKSDWPVMKDAQKALREFRLTAHVAVLSAHRTPKEMMAFAESAHTQGIRVIIAGAGGAAHLPGMIASLSPLPVIGVPVPHGQLNGQDALLSIVQMPRGVPVATVAIGNAWNAGILAAQILAAGDARSALAQAVSRYKTKLKQKVLKSSSAAQLQRRRLKSRS